MRPESFFYAGIDADNRLAKLGVFLLVRSLLYKILGQKGYVAVKGAGVLYLHGLREIGFQDVC